jgi:hypothetical protein
MNLRGSVFPSDPSLTTTSTRTSCATGQCDCTQRQAWPGRDPVDTVYAVGKVAKQHGSVVEARVLPIEMLPSVGEEMCLLVLDDHGKSATMHYRFIYLCPRHMKDLRMGWVALSGRIQQRTAELHAKTALAKVGGDLHKLRDDAMVHAARGQRIGKRVIVQQLFQTTPLLSRVRQAIVRGGRTHLKKQMRYQHGASGARAIPESLRRKKN